MPALPILLAACLVAAPAVAITVTTANGSLLLAGSTPLGDVVCYARTVLVLWNEGDNFLFTLDYAPGTAATGTHAVCALTTARSGAWGKLGPDAVAQDSIARENGKLVVSSVRPTPDGPAHATTTLEPLPGAFRVYQRYWYAGAEDDPFHEASGVLARVEHRTQTAKP